MISGISVVSLTLSYAHSRKARVLHEIMMRRKRFAVPFQAMVTAVSIHFPGLAFVFHI
ncbi:hypothetical protein Cva_00245 [Caedimonas varicaedens]|uniref:Uncharacterized protein n=1 Tax=Caedimonas varicaedens TaxID=1629334 RepID=A0A0K8MCJ9_9PROT|nr:hypothetical protein Cva_00245 [Caedimonas varicaedens]